MTIRRLTTEQALHRMQVAESTLIGHGLDPHRMLAEACHASCVPGHHGLYDDPHLLAAWEEWDTMRFLSGKDNQ